MKRVLEFFFIVQLGGVIILSPVYGQAVVSTTSIFTNDIGSSTVSFNLHNTNGFNVNITEIAGVTNSFGITPVEFWYNPNPVNGAPGAISAANGWIQIASGTCLCFPNTTTTNTQVFFSGLNFILPANTTYGFAVYAQSQRICNTITPPSVPVTVSAAGVDLITGVNIGYSGGVPPASLTNTPRGWIGQITFSPIPLCTGAPIAGVISPTMGCPSFLSLLGGNNPFNSAGLGIQWQQKTSCSNTWTNIPGSTTFTHTINSLPAPLTYRAYVTCLSNGLTDTSNSLLVSSIPACTYCNSAATVATGDDILNVSVGSWNNASVCATLGPGPGSIQNRYSNYTSAFPPVKLLKNTKTPFSVLTGDCATAMSSYGVAVFIDLNRNGSYELPIERVYGSQGSLLSPIYITDSLTIPATAASGITRMRIVEALNASGSAISPCQIYNSGETEDYLVDIQYAPNASGAGVYCSGDTVVLTASAPGVTNPNYLWKLPNGTFTTSPIVNLLNVQASQTGIYTAYILTNTCPGFPPDTSGGRELNVTVHQTPPVPIVAPVIVYCEGDLFDSIPIFGQGLKWYLTPAGGIPDTLAPQINTSISGSAVYYVSQTSNNCESPRIMVTINVVHKPNPPQVISPVNYCQGETPSPLIGTGQNIRWYPVPAGGLGTPIAPVPGTNGQGTFIWYASQTVAGCESQRVPVVVNVNYIPNALITRSRQYVCQHDTLTLSYFGNAISSAEYLWSMPEGGSIVSGTGQGPLTVRFDSSGIRTVKLVVNNGGCKGPESTIDIPVTESPRFTLDIPPHGCTDDTVHLAVIFATMGIDEYEWSFGGSEVLNGNPTAGPYIVKWNTPGEKEIVVQARNNECKSLPRKHSITIHEHPEARITAGKTEICTGDTVEFIGAYETGNSYRWEPYQFFGASHSYIDSGVIDYARYVFLNVTNKYNCQSRDSIFIDAKPCCNIYFPSAFTPNNDGRNDLFRIITVGTHQISMFRIQNRWGQVVFETADERRGWNGTFNGAYQDSGTYFFYIKYKCSDGNFYERKGEVVLVK